MRIRGRDGAAAPAAISTWARALAALALSGATAAWAAEGDLDGGFGSAGVVAESFGGNASGSGVALQADGRIVAVGSLATPDGFPASMVVARYTAEGVLDESFNGTGFALSGDALSASGHDVVVQSGGRIVAIASAGVGRYLDGYVEGYTSAGALDTGYATGGRQVLGIQPTDTAVLDQDRLLIVGVQATVGFTTEARVVRVLAGGGIDSSFGSGGRVVLGFSQGGPGLAVAPDGRMVVALRTVTTLPPPLVFNLVVTRRLADGSPDPQFGNASALVDLGIDAVPAGIAALADGRTLLAVSLSNGHHRLMRLAANGSVDGSFGDGGTLVDSFATALADLTLLPNGRLLLAGGGPQLALARVFDDGAADASFGSGGVATTGFGDGVSSARRALRQPDGKLLAIGTTGEFNSGRLALARFQAEPLAPTCAELQDVRMRLRSVAPPAAMLRLSAHIPAAEGSAVDPIAHGLEVAVRDGNGASFTVAVPGGAYQSATRSGWRVRTSGAVTTWKYRAGAGGPAVERVGLRRGASGAVSVVIDGARGGLATTVDPLTVTITAAPPAGCAERRFEGAASCRRTAGGATVTCRD